MKLSIQHSLLTTSLLLSVTTATPLQRSAPYGYIYTYLLPTCVSQGGHHDGSVITPPPKNLPQNQCVSITLFTSFQGGINMLCPAGQTATITAYASTDCSGSGVTAGTLALDHTPGQCQNILVTTNGNTLPNAGGQSARFTCVV